MQVFPVNLSAPDQVNHFLELPFEIYCHTPQWVPQLAREARFMLDRNRNPYYRHSEAAFFLAGSSPQKPIARLAVLNNRRYNEFNQDSAAFFYLFETGDDPEAAQAVFYAAFEWARARGLTKIIGPKGFTPLDGMGCLVRGFEFTPALGIPYNPPYYPEILAALGFTSIGETVSGRVFRTLKLPEKVRQVAEMVRQRRGLTVARFESRRDLRSFIPRLREMYNGALVGTTGNTPLTEAETKALADQMLWFADPRLIKIILHGGNPVGFLFAYPDISPALQRSRGKLLPLGWADLLLELRRTRWLNINGAGLLEEYRGMGGTALLFNEMYDSIQQSRFSGAEIVQIGVENTRMQNEMRNFGVDFYKTHRLYSRSI